jgi:hypothetical protein
VRALTLAAAGEPNMEVISRADPTIILSAWQPAEDAL